MLSFAAAPYDVGTVDSGGKITLLPALSVGNALASAMPTGDSSVVVGMGLIPLECGFGLQVMTDLRSNHRAIALLDMNRGELIRIHPIRSAMGLSASAADERLLIGGRDSPYGMDVVLYAWRWHEP
ncbi:MAG: hypothetical protein WEE89_08760 [Gemmatimonadota bacterium]